MFILAESVQSLGNFTCRISGKKAFSLACHLEDGRMQSEPCRCCCAERLEGLATRETTAQGRGQRSPRPGRSQRKAHPIIVWDLAKSTDETACVRHDNAHQAVHHSRNSRGSWRDGLP